MPRQIWCLRQKLPLAPGQFLAYAFCHCILNAFHNICWEEGVWGMVQRLGTLCLVALSFGLSACAGQSATPPRAAGQDHCMGVAAARAQDAAYNGVGKALQQKIYEEANVDCRTCAVRASLSMIPIGQP
jgi:hypothetical protein